MKSKQFFFFFFFAYQLIKNFLKIALCSRRESSKAKHELLLQCPAAPSTSGLIGHQYLTCTNSDRQTDPTKNRMNLKKKKKKKRRKNNKQPSRTIKSMVKKKKTPIHENVHFLSKLKRHILYLSKFILQKENYIKTVFGLFF